MWWKNIRIRKLQTVVMFLIVLLCSALLMASFGIITSLSKPFDEFAKECQMPETRFNPYVEEEYELQTIIQRFESLDEVEKVEAMNRYYIEEEIYHGNNQIEAFLDLTEFKDGVYDHVHFFQGDIEQVKTMTDSECALPSCVANEYEVNVGDEITIHFFQNPKTYTVRAIFSSPYDILTSYNSAMIVKELPKDIKGQPILYIYTKDGINANTLETAYRKMNHGLLEGSQNTIDDMKDANQLLGAITGSMFFAIGVIMLLVSCLIINFMIRSMMVADAKTIAVYKTLGYESKDILLMYLKFYFVIVSIACFIGIVIGDMIKNIVLSNMFANIGSTRGQSIFVIGVPCFICIVLFVLLDIYLIIRKTKNIKPVLALNDMNPSNTRKKKYKGNSSMQFSSLGIALRNIRSDRKGMIGVILIAFMTVFIINFGVISLDVANTLRENNDYWLGIDKCDVMVTLVNPEKLEEVQSILDQDTSVNYYLRSNAGYPLTLDWQEEITNTFMYTFIYEDFEKANLPIAIGHNPTSAKEIALTSVMAEEYNKTVGDYITVYLNGQDRVELLVTGIFQTYFNMGHSARVVSDIFNGHDVPFEFITISIYLKDNVNPHDYVETIQSKIGSVGKAYLRTQAMSSIMDMIQEPQKLAIPYVLILVFLIGGVNIFSVVLLRNAKNKKMNGIYKSIGYTSNHLINASILYVVILVAISMVIAIPIIIATYPTIMRLALTMFNFIEYPVHYNGLHIAITNVIICIVFIVFTYCSSLSIKKVAVRDLVNE